MLPHTQFLLLLDNLKDSIYYGLGRRLAVGKTIDRDRNPVGGGGDLRRKIVASCSFGSFWLQLDLSGGKPKLQNSTVPQLYVESTRMEHDNTYCVLRQPYSNLHSRSHQAT